jgi:Holliday junction resolvase RusA-like endonuclease
MREIAFTITGEPQALKRHRTYTHGKGGRVLPFPMQVDPSKKDKENFLAIAHQHRPQNPIDTPIKLILTFYIGRPKKHYRTGQFANQLRPDAPKYHTSTPDTDNLIKFVSDSLNGVFWRDDSLIYIIEAQKVYDEIPRTEVHIVY